MAVRAVCAAVHTIATGAGRVMRASMPAIELLTGSYIDAHTHSVSIVHSYLFNWKLQSARVRVIF